MKIIVSNMVCARCVIVVEQILNKLDLKNFEVAIGSIKLDDSTSSESLNKLTEELNLVGFEIIEDKTEKTIESIKSTLVKYLDDLSSNPNLKMSSYITDHVYYEYSYLSDLFSKTENKTIEKYFIELRIDKAKELLKYSNADISAIGYELGFSSPQHFGNQFKQYVGFTPNTFRKMYKPAL